jgi:hypothetical protein
MGAADRLVSGSLGRLASPTGLAYASEAFAGRTHALLRH